MKPNLLKELFYWLTSLGIAENYANILKIVITVLAVVILSIIADFIAKRLIISAIRTIVKKSKNKWDDTFLDRGVFNNLAHIAPAMVVLYSLSFTISEYPGFFNLATKAINIYLLVIVVLVINMMLKALHDVYKSFHLAEKVSIKSYIQVVRIIIYILAVIIIFSILTDKSISTLLTGIGAMTAVLLFVFKDSILGFIAGIQLAALDMLREGDWISMPKHNSDGIVIDISLTTVKIQNWDKTISTIPTYALVSESFSNWRGMEESGGRRIKRSINIDINSVKFLNEKLIKKFKKFELLEDYMKKKEKELEKSNKTKEESLIYNRRQQTNIGTFRAYIENYLDKNPNINKNLTFLIRQLQATDKGLPIEIYIFSKVKEWVPYERIQADIFDHLFSILPEFELKMFQNPTGSDFRKIV